MQIMPIPYDCLPRNGIYGRGRALFDPIKIHAVDVIFFKNSMFCFDLHQGLHCKDMLLNMS